MNLVLDASIALSWLFERDNAKEADCAERLLLKIKNADIRVPSLWHTEIMNALLVGERRQIITEAQTIDYIARLSALPIKTDDLEVESRRDFVMALAREHHLTAYDAMYLDLALRTNAVLATFDKALAKAMVDAGGTIFS